MAEATRPQWYVQLRGVEEGPMTSRTLRDLAEAGKINPDTAIRKEGMTKTVPASKIKGLLKHHTQTHITGNQLRPDHRPSLRTSHVNSYVSTDETVDIVDINDIRTENKFLIIVKVLIVIFAIFSAFYVIGSSKVSVGVIPIAIVSYIIYRMVRQVK